MESFIDYNKNYIKDNIRDYSGLTFYGSDFSHEITMPINCDGTCTYSRTKAFDYLHEWWAEAADYFEYHKNNFGEYLNPFENPEKYMACMVIEGCSALLSETSVIDKHWNSIFTLDEESIQSILKDIKEIKVIKF